MMSKGLLQSTLSITDIRARNCVDKSTQPIINKTNKENLVLISFQSEEDKGIYASSTNFNVFKI